ncbi:hypothetical protein NMG60_11027123 [Bertholletia excelsa]
MAKVHPQSLPPPPPPPPSYMTSRRETFTIWMKSLVFHGNGCTVFDSNGEIVYRIDNYDERRGKEAYLMDLRGTVLFSLVRKKLRLFGHWDGYKWGGSKMIKERPWFQVRKKYSILRRDITLVVNLCHDKGTGSGFRMVGLGGKLSFDITDSHGRVIAEVRQKQLSSGVPLGEDVLTLAVEPQMDHSLVMALVTVYGLMADKI